MKFAINYRTSTFTQIDKARRAAKIVTFTLTSDDAHTLFMYRQVSRNARSVTTSLPTLWLWRLINAPYTIKDGLERNAEIQKQCCASIFFRLVEITIVHYRSVRESLWKRKKKRSRYIEV